MLAPRRRTRREDGAQARREQVAVEASAALLADVAALSAKAESTFRDALAMVGRHAVEADRRHRWVEDVRSACIRVEDECLQDEQRHGQDEHPRASHGPADEVSLGDHLNRDTGTSADTGSEPSPPTSASREGGQFFDLGFPPPRSGPARAPWVTDAAWVTDADGPGDASGTDGSGTDGSGIADPDIGRRGRHDRLPHVTDDCLDAGPHDGPANGTGRATDPGTDAVHPDAIHSNAVRDDAAHPEAVHPEAVHSDTARDDTARPNTAHPEAVGFDAVPDGGVDQSLQSWFTGDTFAFQPGRAGRVVDETALDEASVDLLERRRAALARLGGFDVTAGMVAAARYRQLAELQELAFAEHRLHGGSDLNLVQRSLVAQLAAMRRVGHRTAARELATAHTLTTELPATLAALEAGRVHPGHVPVLLDHADQIDEAARAAHDGLPSEGITAEEYRSAHAQIDADYRELKARLESRLVERAEHCTPGRLRQDGARWLEANLAATREARHRRARDRRCVSTRELDNGMSEFTAIIPTALAAGIHQRLTGLAKRLETPDEQRSRDQLRADAFCDLLLTGLPTEPTAARAAVGLVAQVQITLPALTLLGRSTEPVTLNGITPIQLADALRLAAAAPSWTRVLTSPFNGAALTSDTYRPTAAQRAFLSARDKQCRFPGCLRPASDCELDHSVEYQHGGPTSTGNLAAECKSHHVLRHTTAWRITQLQGGELHWTDPAGTIYPTGPPQAGPIYTSDDLTELRTAPGAPAHPPSEATTVPTTEPAASTEKPAADTKARPAQDPASPAATRLPDDEPPPF